MRNSATINKNVQQIEARFKSGLNETNQTPKNIVTVTGITIFKTGLTTTLQVMLKFWSKLFLPSYPLNIVSELWLMIIIDRIWAGGISVVVAVRQRGQGAGLEIWRSWVQVPPWPLAGFVPGSPWLNSSAALVNSQVVCLLPVGILKGTQSALRPRYPGY